MHRLARGLVDDEQGIVLEHHRQRPSRRGRRVTLRLGDPQRGDTHLITFGEAISLLHPAAIDSHFATAQDAVDMALGHAFGDA